MIADGVSRPTELYLRGGAVGILLIHGFTGSTSEMSLFANYFHQRGLTVLAPLLPGHGTSPADLNTKRWPDWVRHVKQSLDRLNVECQTVAVGGLSLGALLSLYAAANWTPIHSVIAYSPPMPIARARSYLFPLKFLIPTFPKPKDYFADPNAQARLWNYDVAPLRAYYELLEFVKIVRADLHKIKCPILVVHSTADTITHPTSAQNVLNGVGSKDKDLLTLHDCGHVLTLDAEWQQVAEKTYDFIENH